MITDSEKIRLIRQAYTTFLLARETFDEPWDESTIGSPTPGSTLAYLMGAIACDGTIEIEPDFEEASFFKEHFDPEHPIWEYVRFPNEPEGGR